MQARAIPVRGADRHPRIRPWRRTPFAALLLSMLALASPSLTLAPLNASEPLIDGVHMVHGRATAEIVTGLQHGLRRLDPASRPGRPAARLPTAAPMVDAAAFQSALDAARARGAAWGVTFAAVRDGQLLWAGSSGRLRDGRTSLTPDTPLVIGSVTKTYVAATVLALVDEGVISLSDPARRYLPEMPRLSRRITVAQLLDHTSGLADLFNDATRTGLETDPEHAWSASEILATLHAPWYEPGEGWAYANTNYYLLGLIVERVTGTTLADELARRFFEPLDLHATLVLGSGEAGPLAPAWTSIFWGSGAMSASAADVARWGDALYRSDLLTTAGRAAMLTANDHDYGLGVQRLEMGGRRGWGHTGLLNTYTTLLFHLPRERVTLALLVNRSHVDLSAMLRAETPGGDSLLDLALGR